MSKKEGVRPQDLLGLIEDFIGKTKGLEFHRLSLTELEIIQKTDSKKMKLESHDLSDVIFRKDPEEKEFIQINFCNGEKILLTEELVGFKPFVASGIQADKLPKVVTTVDLFSVLEAIEETLSEAKLKAETESLKEIFQSILLGGEKIGFDLSVEKTWLKRLPAHVTKAVS